MAGGVDQGHIDRTDAHDVARLVGHQRPRHPGGSLHPRHLFSLEVNGDVDLLEQGRDPLDGVTHHLAADVIRVIVRRQHADRPHLVGIERRQQISGRVGRVHEQGLTRLPVPDGIREVHHRTRHRVVPGEVPTGEQLAEVQTVGGVRHR